MSIPDLDNCPEGDANWKGEDIYQYFLRQKNNPESRQYAYYSGMTDEQILMVASYYGYTVNNPICFRKVVGIELPLNHPEHYDGVSYWQCPECKIVFNRVTGKKVKLISEFAQGGNHG